MCWLVVHPLLIAHRGAPADAPENTLPAFARALALGADGIELDVRLTRDGVPVVFHDATLTRLASRRQSIAGLALADLGAVRIGGASIPTLSDVLDLVGDRAIVQIEIKPTVPAAPVIRAIAQSRTKVVLASFEPEILADARRLAPHVPRMLITDGKGLARARRREQLSSTLAALDATGVSLNYRAIRSPVLVAALQSHGWSVWCWTVNGASAMVRLAAWGVDAILSDNLALLRSTLVGSDRCVHSTPPSQNQ